MSEIRVDTISERTSANGVTIDGLTIKDGGITATTGAIVLNEASADLDFRVESNGNTHMLFVDGGNNRVGIATTPDLGVGLHIRSADSGGSATSTADELVVEGSGDTGIQILSGASSEAGIAFGDSGDSNVGLIGYDHANNRFRFKTNDAVQWYLDSSGNWLPAATDHGIYLGVTSATASNLLDDYEEGEFTYTITGSTSGSLSARSGYTKGSYVKIGNWVQVNIRYETDADNSLSGNVYWSLPFTMANPNGSDADAAVAPGYIRDDSMGTNARSGYYFLSEGNSFVYLLFSREGAANNILEVANDGDTDGVMEGCISISYRTT